MGDNVVGDLNVIIRDINTIVDKPETFLSPQALKIKKTTSVLKQLYDLTKQNEVKGKKSLNVLPKLIVDGFDAEQIWQEIELQNNFICNGLVSEVAHLLARKNKLRFPLVDEEEKCLTDSNLPTSDDDEDSIDEDSRIIEYEKNDFKMKQKTKKKKIKSSIVDDKMFKLSEMNDFLLKVEKEEELGKPDKSDALIDYFQSDESEHEKEPCYDDFFDQPHSDDNCSSDNDSSSQKTEKEEVTRKRKGKSNIEDANVKKVRFTKNSTKEEDDEETFYTYPSDDESKNKNEDKEIESDTKKSTFELRQERLKNKIKTLEEQALTKKSWQLQGEITADSRPQNSLLEEFVEFDLTTRPAPVITEETTLKLEDIIQQRIKDKAWDDVERKIKPVDDPYQYKKKLVLDQEKSKLSLAEIYEQEFVNKRDATNPEVQDKPVEVPPEHIEIQKSMKSLFHKLDALSNFHYTPKQVAPEIKIISNVPAINMEDVAPVAVSDATLLAPEEIKTKPKGEVMGKTERSDTDKKRERRKKKLKQREKAKEREKREKLVEKINPGMGNKYSKEKASKMLEKAVSQNKNISKMNEDSKTVKSSKTFFSKLQDEVSSHIKSKSGTKNVGGKKKLKLK